MLDHDCIHVWRISLGEVAGEAPLLVRGYALLSAEERRRADAFRLPGLRRDYVLCHAALRIVLGRCLEISPERVPIVAAPPPGGGGGSTKPEIEVCPGDAEAAVSRTMLRFNLSHTRGAALIGAAWGREIGIDIERVRVIPDLEDLAHSIMSNEELAAWREYGPDERVEAFYRVWTRKEAYLKAIGLGLFRTLGDVTVPVERVPDRAERWRVQDLAAAQVSEDSGGELWTVADVPVPEGYAAAVCSEGGEAAPLNTEDLPLAAIGQI